MKAFSKQLILVLALILTKLHPVVMFYVRYFINFLIIASYKSHDKETLGYLNYYLALIYRC